MSSSLQSNLLLRCTKVWEDYVEVEWRREFSDGRRTLNFIVKAEAPDLQLTKTLGCDRNTYRISGLPAKTTVQVSVQIEVHDRTKEGGTDMLPPVSITARTLTSAQLDVGSVMPDQLHARLSRFPDRGKIAQRKEQLAQQREQARELGLLPAAENEDVHNEEENEEDEMLNNVDDDGDNDAAPASLVKRHLPGSKLFIDNNEVPIAKFQMQITQIGRVLSHDIPLQDFVLETDDQQRGSSKNLPLDFFVKQDIEVNARYTAKARAVSIFGDYGRWSPQTRFLTLLPVKVEVTDVGETEVALQWGRGIEGDDSYIDDAAIENLTVAVELLPSQKEVDLDSEALATPVDTKSFSNEVRRYTVKGLESGRTYRIKTRYSNILGDTSAWDSIRATTLFPVEPCEVVVVGTNFIHVRWKRSKPAPHDTVSIPPHLCVTNYKQQQEEYARNALSNQSIASMNMDDQIAEWEIRCAVGTAFTSASLPGKDSETRLTNLSPGVEYAIDVRAVTPTGRVGLWSPVVTATVLHALQPRMIAAGESWVKVAWDRKEAMFRDNIERFHVQINCMTSPFRVAKYFPGDTTRYTFRDLKPNTRYQISLQSFSDGRWGPWGTPVSIATCSVPVPRLVRRGEEFVQLEWSSDYYEKAEVESAKQVFQLRVHRRLATGKTETQETIVDRPSYRSPKLGPLATIDVKVRSFDYSTNDWGSWGPSISFKTLPSAIVITHVGETVSEVSWNRIPALYRAITDEQLLNGVEDPLMPASVAQYQLRINKLIEEAASVVRDELHGTFYCRADQPTTFVIPDLTPDTDYSVQISYLDEHDHWSVFSSPVLFSTTPKLQLEVRDIGESRTVLQWGRNSKKRSALMSRMMANSNAQQQAAVMEGFVKEHQVHQPLTDQSKSNKEKDQLNNDNNSNNNNNNATSSDPGASYRIVVQDIGAEYFKQQQSDNSNNDPDLKRRALPLQFTVRGELSLTVTELRSNTAYRAEISCSSRNTSWGTWSEPVHFMTMPPIQAQVQNCGETFVSVRWVRAERNSFMMNLFPNLKMKNLPKRYSSNSGDEGAERRSSSNRVQEIDDDDDEYSTRRPKKKDGLAAESRKKIKQLMMATSEEGSDNKNAQDENEKEFGGSIARGKRDVHDNDDDQDVVEYGNDDDDDDDDELSAAERRSIVWIQDNDDGEYELVCSKMNTSGEAGPSSSTSPPASPSGDESESSTSFSLMRNNNNRRGNNNNNSKSKQLLAQHQQDKANYQSLIVETSALNKNSSSINSNSNSNNNNNNNNNKVSFSDLEPDTTYVIKIRSRLSKSLEWSTWSDAISAKTALATQVRVASAGVDGVTLSWGFDAAAVAEEEERKQKELILLYGQEYYNQTYGQHHQNNNNNSSSSTANDVKVEYNFELEIKGFDDNLSIVKTIRSSSSSNSSTFQLNGLNIGCCYGARARRQERITGLWGNFCNWHYFSLVSQPVQLVEASQDWIHVQWEPFTDTNRVINNNNNINSNPNKPESASSYDSFQQQLATSSATSNNNNHNNNIGVGGSGSGGSTTAIATAPHAIILTLTGDGEGHAIQVQDPTSTTNEYAFSGLAPDTPYAVRLLAIIDRPRHDPEEYEMQKRLAQNKPRRIINLQQGSSGSSPGGGGGGGNENDKDATLQNEVHGAPFSLPIVSSDFFRFAMSGLVARTKKVLLAKFEKVGQTYAVLSWVADGDVAATSFEVQVNELEVKNSVKKTRTQVVHGRCYAIIKDLAPESRIRCSVRTMSRSATAAAATATKTTTSWCPPVEIVLQPRITVTLNHHHQGTTTTSVSSTSSPPPKSNNNNNRKDSTSSHNQLQQQQQQNQPPVGENYLSISWLPDDIGGPGVEFEVRVERGGDELFYHTNTASSNNNNNNSNDNNNNPLRTALVRDDDDDEDSVQVFTTRDQRYTIQGLRADTVYTVRIRSKTIIDLEDIRKHNEELSAATPTTGSKNTNQKKQHQPEDAGKNNNDASSSSASSAFYNRQPLPSQVCYGSWSDPFIKSTLSPLAVTVQNIRENSGITHWCRRARARFSSRWWETCTAADKREDVSSISAFQINIFERLNESAVFRLIVDEVIPDNQVDFQTCSRSISMLRPDAEYEICIRANTGLQWGRWSERYRFETKKCVQPRLSHVRESACAVQWQLPPPKSSVSSSSNSSNNTTMIAFQPSSYYVAKITAIRTGDSEVVPLKTSQQQQQQQLFANNFCILSGFQPNTSYSIALRSQYADGDTGPWGDPAYFVTQAPLEVDVGNVSESFANILWRRVPQRSISQDLIEQRSGSIRDLTKMIDKLTARRMKMISTFNLQQQQQQHSLSSSPSNRKFSTLSTSNSSSNANFFNRNSMKAFGESENDDDDEHQVSERLHQSKTASTLFGSPMSTTPQQVQQQQQQQRQQRHFQELAKLEANIEQLTKKRDLEVELREMHAEELDDQAVYAEGIVDCIEVVCENLNYVGGDGSLTSTMMMMGSSTTQSNQKKENGDHNEGGNDDDDEDQNTSITSYSSSSNNNNRSRAGTLQFRLQSKTLTKGETFCRQDNLDSNTPYAVRVRTLVREQRHRDQEDENENHANDRNHSHNNNHGISFFSEADIICLAGTTSSTSSASLGDQVQVSLHPTKGLYGIWHQVEFTTLKPIALFLRAVGSESAVFQWDTGAAIENTTETTGDTSSASTVMNNNNNTKQQQRRRRTAITAYNVKVYPIGIPGEEINATLQDAAATGHIVRNLEASTEYAACVRVCYEGVQWGGWSETVQLSTLDLLQAKIETLEENLARILVWRETGPNTPPITSHQLLVNGVMCPDPFEIERGASTVLTMDSITLDTEFVVEIADFVCPGEWQKPREIMRFESLAKPPLNLVLSAKKDLVHTICWSYEPQLDTDYVFWLQRAVVGPRALSRGIEPEWETLATLTDKQLELELPQGVNIDWYLFRLRVAKFRHTVDPDEPTLPESNMLCVPPHNIYPALDTSKLYWSNWSPPLRLPQPRPPEEPRNLQLRRVGATRAELQWSHSPTVRSSNGGNNVTYHVFICPVMDGGMWSLAGSTTSNSIEVTQLMPSTRYRCYLQAENNFGKTTGSKRLNFTTRFDQHNEYQANQQQQRHFDVTQQQQQSSMMKQGGSDGAQLLRNVRGLPSR